MPNLTPQQARILEATDGRSIPEIAQALGMTPRAVKYHSDILRARFNVKNRRQLIPLGKECDDAEHVYDADELTRVALTLLHS